MFWKESNVEEGSRRVHEIQLVRIPGLRIRTQPPGCVLRSHVYNLGNFHILPRIHAGRQNLLRASSGKLWHESPRLPRCKLPCALAPLHHHPSVSPRSIEPRSRTGCNPHPSGMGSSQVRRISVLGPRLCSNEKGRMVLPVDRFRLHGGDPSLLSGNIKET